MPQGWGDPHELWRSWNPAHSALKGLPCSTVFWAELDL
jgi:hypothetical protein